MKLPEYTQMMSYLGEIGEELMRARSIHQPFSSARHGHSVIEEEFDEFWDAIKADDIEHARKEVLQLAAMCLSFLTDVK